MLQRSHGSRCCGKMGISTPQHLLCAHLPLCCAAPTIRQGWSISAAGTHTHPGAGAPRGSQTHKELQQLKSAS